MPMEARGVRYEAGGRALADGVDLTLTSGGITVIMGPNGAGKSLLLRLLHGVLAPSGGSIRWGGQALNLAVRKRQAMVAQKPVLLRRTVAANLDFALSLCGLSAQQRCQRRRDLMVQTGLSALAGQPARALSGGEQQRLALARALAGEPEVLLMDEPTASLDPASTAMIEDIAGEAHRTGTKVIFVTHDSAQARRLGGEVVFMHRGKVVEHTPGKQFFNRPASQAARNFLEGKLVV